MLIRAMQQAPSPQHSKACLLRGMRGLARTLTALGHDARVQLLVRGVVEVGVR